MTSFKKIRPERSGHYRRHVRDYLSPIASAATRSGDDHRQSGGEERLVGLLSITGERGPLWSLFRLYLATRIDLFSEADRRDLAHVSRDFPSTPFAEVKEQVERELGARVERTFLTIEPIPHLAAELTISYLALLHSGERVSVTTLRPEFVIWPQAQLDTLRSLSYAAFPDDWTASAARQVFDTFEDELHERLDLSVEAENLAAVAKDTATSEVMYVPAVYSELCRRGLLVTEGIPALRLSEVIAGYTGPGRGAEKPGPFAVPSHRLARVLCTAWLREVFLTSRFPVYCQPGDVFLRREGQVAFLSGPYFDLPESAAQQVWEYMLAVAQDNPDESCRTLLPQTVGYLDEEKEADLTAQFRQAVTFFQGHGIDSSSATAARIQRHLELVRRAGLHLRPSVQNFYRGLFSLMTTVPDLRPARDPLLDAIEDVWVTRIFGSFRQMMQSEVFTEMANKYAAAMIEAPKTMNEALKSFARSAQGDERPVYRDSHPGSKSRSLTGLLILAAIILLVHGKSFQIPMWWADRIGFVAYCVAGLLAVKIALSD